MLAKLISVGFFPPIIVSLVRQTPDLKPFSKKKEIKSEQVMCNRWYLEIILPCFFIAKKMRIALNFSSYVLMVYAKIVFHYCYNIFKKFLRHRNPFHFASLTKF